MCGLTILINQKNLQVDQEYLKKMNDLIQHRGPDGEGEFFDHHLAMAHRRLAIIDLDPRSNQPMRGPDDLVVSYNGEIYNYIELKKELESLGYSFKTESDTEVLLLAYHCWGKQCLEKLNGMFAFAIFDPLKNELFVARDRFGIKPVYFSQIGDYFSVVSEIKQLTALPDWKAVMNEKRAFEYLVYGYVATSEQTMFNGVFELKAGHYLSYCLKKHNYEISKWYFLENRVAETKKKTFKNVYKEYKNRFVDAVKIRLRSDVQVGSCLSGGMDSSSIVCVADTLNQKKKSAQKQFTISSCFENKKYDEQEFIDVVTEATNTENIKVFPSDEDLFKKIDEIIWYQDEPFGSTSIFAQYSVFEAAKKQNLKVMLDGQGADEQLAGYHSFFIPHLYEDFCKLNLKTLVQELYFLKKRHAVSYLSVFLKLVFILMMNTVNKNIFEKIKRVILFSWKSKWLNKSVVSSKNIDRKNVESFSFEQLSTTSLPSLLHYEDRSSMMHSIESRVPFLDYRLVEFTVALNKKYKIKNGITKHVLREGLAEFLPDKIKNRVCKLGFVTSEKEWLIKNRKHILSVLNREWPDFINKEKFLKYVNRTLGSDKAIDFTIWRYYCFQKWCEVFSVSFQKI